jgi:hypothetical protein
MDLMLLAIGCGLALGLVAMLCRTASQVDRVALIGETYLRATGGTGRPMSSRLQETARH